MVVHSRIRLVDCGPFKSRFSADFMSASRPKPDIQLELLERSAADPDRVKTRSISHYEAMLMIIVHFSL